MSSCRWEKFRSRFTNRVSGQLKPVTFNSSPQLKRPFVRKANEETTKKFSFKLIRQESGDKNEGGSREFGTDYKIRFADSTTDSSVPPSPRWPRRICVLKNDEKSTDSEVSATDYLKSNLFAHLSREERIRLYKQQKRKEIAERFGISLEGQVDLQSICNRVNTQPQRPLHMIEERKPVKESKIYIESSHKQLSTESSALSAPPIRRLVRQSNVPESLILYKSAKDKNSIVVKELRERPTKTAVTSKVNEYERMAKSGGKKVERTSSERIKNSSLSNSISEHIKKLYSMGHSAPTIQDMLYGHKLAENPPKDEEIRLEISKKKKIEDKPENSEKQKFEKQINSKRKSKKLLKKSHSIGGDIRFVITKYEDNEEREDSPEPLLPLPRHSIIMRNRSKTLSVTDSSSEDEKTKCPSPRRSPRVLAKFKHKFSNKQI
ncbi:DgyrCDS13810 [Dimorphilus gyrociliatus]|uniref:DgyrCDS13810 n=1 Tax=Dimorphilus gyrociliatus TaxID=2664684 RepID=A0A7I8WBW8_9ANNE|nr:DgyrCDS13810 [Dimorphilus gyrociliatus]